MLKICKHQLQIAFTSPRIYIAIFLGCVMQIVSVMPLLEFSKGLNKPLCIFEGFIYFNCDTYIMSAALLGVVIMASDIPFCSENETYTLLRASRRKWVAGKVLYLLSVCILYYVVVLLAGMLFISENAYMADFWSEPVYYLARQMDFGDTAVYFPYIHILLLSPFQAMMAGFALSVCYGFAISLFLFFFNLKLPKMMGYLCAMMVHVIGYVLTVLFLTLKVVKYSFLGNSLLMYHEIGGNYKELFLTLPQSFLIYAVTTMVLIFLILKSIKKYDFKITVGAKH